jgi:hypothetical protein
VATIILYSSLSNRESILPRSMGQSSAGVVLLTLLPHYVGLIVSNLRLYCRYLYSEYGWILLYVIEF